MVSAARRRAAGKKGGRDGRTTASFDEKLPPKGRWQEVGDAGEGEWWLAKRREERGRAGERGKETSTLGGGERGRDAVGDTGQGDGGWRREGREREGWRGRGGDIDAGGGEGGREAVDDAGEGDGGWRRGGKREEGRRRAGEGQYLGGRSRNVVGVGVVGASFLQKADGKRPAASFDEREGERREGGGRWGGHEEERGRAQRWEGREDFHLASPSSLQRLTWMQQKL